MLLAAALCAGILTFANADFVEAADQQSSDVTSIQTTVSDTQQLSTKRANDED